MKLFLSLTLNIVYCFQIFVVKKTLSLKEGATIRSPLPTQLPVEPDMVVEALRVMVVEAEWLLGLTNHD